MSLINQMLRDLQQQKKDDAPPGFKPPRRSIMEKILTCSCPLCWVVEGVSCSSSSSGWRGPLGYDVWL